MKSERDLKEIEDDQYGWGHAVNHCADQIVHSFDPDGSCVVSIEGKWGTGKTTFVNFVVSAIKKLDGRGKTLPIIINYSPWLNPHVEHSKFFFDQLAKEVDFGKAKKLVLAFASTSVTFLESLNNLSKNLLVIGALLGFLGITVFQIENELIVNNRDSILQILFIVILFLLVPAILGPWLVPKKKSIYELKSELAAYFKKKMKSGVVVIIDDLDRLSRDQILGVLQLVKNNGDLPYVVYVLCMDHEETAKILQTDSRTHSEMIRFLEKFIQVRYPIPTTTSTQLLREIYELENHVRKQSASNIEQLWDSSRWKELVDGSINVLCKDIRAIRRLEIAVESRLSLFVRKGFFEVNPVDVLALEAIRLFSPLVFDLYRQKPYVFVRGQMDFMFLDQSKELRKQLLDKSLDSVGREERAAVIEILRNLFPMVKIYFDNIGDNYDVSDGKCGSRSQVGDYEISSIYHRLDVGKRRIPESTCYSYLNNVLSNDWDMNMFVFRNGKLTDDMWTTLFHKAIDNPEGNPSEKEITHVLKNQMNLMDHWHPEQVSGHLYPLQWSINSCTGEWISKIPTLEKRRAVVKEALILSTGFWGRVSYLYHLEIDEDGQVPHIHKSLELSNSEIVNLNGPVIESILLDIESVKLAESAGLVTVFRYLKKYLKSETYMSALINFTRDDDRFAALSRKFFGKSGSPFNKEEVFKLNEILALDERDLLRGKLESVCKGGFFSDSETELLLKSFKDHEKSS